MTAMS